VVTTNSPKFLATGSYGEIVAHAEKSNPSIVDQISGFYAEHPTLIKTLGGAALTVALAKIAERQYGN
jgi:hypothetical protein